MLIYIDCILLVEGQNNQAEQMCFEQWCRFCGSTLFVFWRNVLHCSRMCLYVEAFVWYNVFLVPCFFRFVFGSIDVMFWGRGRPYTATELCLFILFCTMFVWCRVCSAVFVGQRMLCFEGEGDLILLQNCLPACISHLKTILVKRTTGKKKYWWEGPDMEFVKKFTPPDFPAKNFTTLQEIIFFSLTLQQLS